MDTAGKPTGNDGYAETKIRAGLELASVDNKQFTIAVLEGPDAGKTLSLDRTTPTRLLVGKSQACALCLTDPMVSRRHAAFDVGELGLHFLDLGSTNGSFIGGLRVTDAYLTGGEVVRIGATTLRIDAHKVQAKAVLSSEMSFGRMVGASVEMRRIYPLCERIAASDIPVIVEGESGTGKEVLAEALHDESPRAQGPFVVFDCTSVPAELFESALFGHERGSFTGAVAARKGAFEQADKGTLFIDEIGDLALPLQAKLLRAIERKEVQRVGSEKWTRVDVRLISATRRDLDKEVADGRFRDDLFFRLSVARVELPPLRRRAGDIGVLSRHFWRSLGGDPDALPEEILARFERYEWPGNVRELRNAVAQHLALGDLSRFAADSEGEASEVVATSTDLIDRVLAMNLPLARARQEVVAEFERLYVERVLAAHGGNVRRAAKASGLARRYFQLLKAKRTVPAR